LLLLVVDKALDKHCLKSEQLGSANKPLFLFNNCQTV